MEELFRNTIFSEKLQAEIHVEFYILNFNSETS